jgi:hypothetical protein
MPHHRYPSQASRKYDFSEWISSAATIQDHHHCRLAKLQHSGGALFASTSFIFPQMRPKFPLASRGNFSEKGPQKLGFLCARP